MIKIDMKILFLIVSSMVLQHCGTDHVQVFTKRYVLENAMNMKIKIDYYENGVFRDTDSIQGQGVIFEISTKNSEKTEVTASGALQADSVVVVFNDDRRQIYTNISRQNRINIAPEKRNILLDSSYIIDNEEYRFSFKMEDYENAEEIGG